MNVMKLGKTEETIFEASRGIAVIDAHEHLSLARTVSMLKIGVSERLGSPFPAPSLTPPTIPMLGGDATRRIAPTGLFHSDGEWGVSTCTTDRPGPCLPSVGGPPVMLSFT